MRTTSRNILIFSILLVLYSLCHIALTNLYRNSSGRHQQRSSFSMFPSTILKAVSGEFKGIVADLIVFEAGAQVGAEVIKGPDGGYITVKKDYDWNEIHQLFVKSQSLDPYFQHTYMLAQGLLPWEPHMVEETLAILRIAAKSLPWDWNPLHLIGFNYYYFMNAPGKAGRIFLEAAQIKYAPPFLSILGARLAHKGNETEAAILLMKSVLAGLEQTDPSYSDIEKRLLALEGTLIIEQSVKKYFNQFNHFPKSINDLLETGKLKSVPPNPYNRPYCLRKNGYVNFDDLKCSEAN